MNETRTERESMIEALGNPTNCRPEAARRRQLGPIPPNPTMMAAYEKLIANGWRIHIDTGRAVGKHAFTEFLREQGITIVDSSIERPDGIET